MTFLLFLIYGAATVASLISLVLFLFGRLFGGVLDPDGAPASRISDEERRAAAVQALAAPATPVGRIGRFLNAMGDNLQRAAGLAFFFFTLVIAAFAGIKVWTEGNHLFILVVAILAAGNMLYYLSAEPAERAKRAIVVSTLMTLIAVLAIGIQVGFKNNTEWYTPQIITKSVVVGEGKDVLMEDVIAVTTPNGTYLDLQKLVGGDAGRVQTQVELVHLACLPGANPDLAGYETRCKMSLLQLRAQRAKPHLFNLAAGEYSSLEDLVLARQQDQLTVTSATLDARETAVVQQKRAERLEAGKVPLLSRFSNKEIAILLLVLAIAVTLITIGVLSPKTAATPTPTQAAPTRAP